VKYVILIYSRNPLPTPALLTELTSSGELIDHVSLADPVNTKTILPRGILNAPLPTGHDHLTAYLIIDCDTPTRATEIATRLPTTHPCAVELRPIMEPSGLEM
jgi:hypothetical protein